MLVLTAWPGGGGWLGPLGRELGSDCLPRAGGKGAGSSVLPWLCPLQLLTHAAVRPCVSSPWSPQQCPRVCFRFPGACWLPGLRSCLVPSPCPLPQPLTLGPGRRAAARQGLKADTKHPPSSGVVGEGALHRGDGAAARPCRVLDHGRMVALMGWIWIPGARLCHLPQLSRLC